MVATSLALLTILAQRSKDQYTLGRLNGHFVVRNGARSETVPDASAAKAKTFLSFRRDRRWVVWDKRGLTMRDGDWTVTDRLQAIPTSPRFQDKDAIRATLAKVKSGGRKLAANGLSGARRVGSKVYLLPRWEGDDGKPWLEVLLVVDLAQPHPKPRFLGAFEGLSLGEGLIDDRLGIQNGRLAVAVNGEDGWGIGTFDPAKGKFAFDERGGRLVAMDGGKTIEETSYGVFVAGRQQGGHTVPWLELRGPADFVPGDGTVFLRAGTNLRNAETGAEFRLPRRAALRRTPAGLLVYWPEGAPRSARLLDPDRLEERARWEKGTRSTEGKAKDPVEKAPTKKARKRKPAA